MRVLACSRHLPPHHHGGSYVLFRHLIDGLAARHEVVVLTSEPSARAAGLADALTWAPAGSDGRDRWREVVRLSRAIGEVAPEVVLANDREFVTSRVPTVSMLLDVNFNRVGDGGPGGAARRLWAFGALWRSRAVVAISDDVRSLIPDRVLGDRRVEVVHPSLPWIGPGLDVGPVGPRPARLRVAYVARHRPEKGQDVLLDAVIEARRRGVPVDLHLAGTVEDEGFFARLRARAAAGSGIVVQGPVADSRATYEAADVAAFPTRLREGYGLSALEPLALGRVVIAADAPAIAEATGGFATTVRGHDMARWADAIEATWRDWDRHAAVAREGQAFVLRARSWGAFVAGVEGVLTEVVSRSKPGEWSR